MPCIEERYLLACLELAQHQHNHARDCDSIGILRLIDDMVPGIVLKKLKVAALIKELDRQAVADWHKTVFVECPWSSKRV